ncbi:MAG: hypothetical protein JEZ06_16105 [Anaerolineaceae bacterium]|nr:hypothetical protein [Anaerolineaceae bacterium]
MENKIMDWLKNIFKKPGLKGNEMDLGKSPTQLKRVLQMIQKTQETELTCDEVFVLIDQYAEMVMRGEDVEQFMPLMHAHIDLCPDCREEYEALLAMLELDLN